MTDPIQTIGFIAAVTLPLWNIPLILKIIKRKSSQDLSMCWILGVWASIILMAPAGFQSKDLVWRSFNIMNLILFSGVAITALKYRKGCS